MKFNKHDITSFTAQIIKVPGNSGKPVNVVEAILNVSSGKSYTYKLIEDPPPMGRYMTLQDILNEISNIRTMIPNSQTKIEFDTNNQRNYLFIRFDGKVFQFSTL